MSNEDDYKKRSSGTLGFIVGLICILVSLLMMFNGGLTSLLSVTPKGYRSSGLPMFLFLLLGLVLVWVSIKNDIPKKDKSK